MNITFFEIEPWEKEYLEKSLKDQNLTFVDEPLSDENVSKAATADIVSVFIHSHINGALLAKLPNLKGLTTRSMGFDHIDAAACNAKKIPVSYVPTYGEHTVAEHAFALLLALSRNIVQARERTEKGDFDYRGLEGFDLFGKTIGVIGTGRIGACVLRIAKGFGMSLLASDPFPNQALAAELGFKYVSVDELLPACDVVSLHAPFTKENFHLIGTKQFKMMKRGSVLVNTARGGLVDTVALLKALDDKTLAGACLDVLEEETFLAEEAWFLGKDFPNGVDMATVARDHILFQRPNVVITPHIAFNSREAVERILATTVDDIRGLIADKPVNLIPKV